MEQKILVTGGAGFIGSHLCEALVRIGHNVVAVDNFDPMYPRRQKEENLKWLKKQNNFSLVEGDVRDKKLMEEVFAKEKFDFVYHLAGRGGIPQSKKDPFFYVDDIVVGTLNILEACAKYKVKTIVNASTSSVYAQTKGKPSKETDDTDSPGSVYTAAKRAAELLCHAYHVLYGIGAVNVRFFSVYGPRGRQDMVVYKFTKNISEGKPILNYDPDPKRDFTYVGDIVSGLISMLDLPKDTYEVLNLGNGKPVEISKSIKIIEEILGKKAVMGETLKPPPSDMAVTNSDSSKAKKLLKWEAKVELKEGIQKFVEWYQTTTQFTD